MAGLGQMHPYLLSVFFILDGIHCAARLGIKHEVKAGVFTEATGIAEEGILFIIVDGPEEPRCSGQWNKRFGARKSELQKRMQRMLALDVQDKLPALVTLVNILPTIATDAWVGRNRGTAARTLKGLCGGLVVLIEVCKLNHQVRSHNGQRQVNLDFRLSRRQLNFLGFVPASWPRRDNKSYGAEG